MGFSMTNISHIATKSSLLFTGARILTAVECHSDFYLQLISKFSS